MGVNIKAQRFDNVTKARVKLVAKILTGIPSDKAPFFSCQ